MKKGAILIALIFLISAVSAEMSCPDGSRVISDQNEIDTGSTRSINGIIIGLIRTEDLNVIKKTTAYLMIDARRVELSKSAPLQEVELNGDYYDVEILNATEEEAKIKVDGNSETIAEGESETVDGKIFALITSGESTDPSVPHVRILAGMEEISISNDAPTKKITFKNKAQQLQIQLKLTHQQAHHLQM